MGSAPEDRGPGVTRLWKTQPKTVATDPSLSAQRRLKTLPYGNSDPELLDVIGKSCVDIDTSLWRTEGWPFSAHPSHCPSRMFSAKGNAATCCRPWELPWRLCRICSAVQISEDFVDPELGSQACAMVKGAGLLNFRSFQKVVVSCGRERFTVLHKGSFVSKITTAVSKTASSETPARVKFHLKAQGLRATQFGLEALCTHHGHKFPERLLWGYVQPV